MGERGLRPGGIGIDRADCDGCVMQGAVIGIGHNGFDDAQDGEGVLIHPKFGVRALLGLYVAGQPLEVPQSIGGGKLALLEAADDLQHPFGEPAILRRVLVHQFARDAAKLGGLAHEGFLKLGL